MAGYRAKRIAELIHRELVERLRREVKDPRVTMISITSVEVTPDLREARVLYLPFGGGGDSDELAEGLKSAARQLRGPIGRALRLRHSPEISFQFDAQHEEAIRVNQLLDTLARERADREPEDEEGA